MRAKHKNKYVMIFLYLRNVYWNQTLVSQESQWKHILETNNTPMLVGWGNESMHSL